MFKKGSSVFLVIKIFFYHIKNKLLKLSVIVPLVLALISASGCDNKKKRKPVYQPVENTEVEDPVDDTNDTDGSSDDDSSSSDDDDGTDGEGNSSDDSGDNQDEEDTASAVTLQGAINDFPAELPAETRTAQSSFAESSSDGGLSGPELDSGTGITRDDMIPAEALVSLFLLTDIDLENPVATVSTGANGSYEVTAEDVRAYLQANDLVAEGADEDTVITAFRALGPLQVRALIVREEDRVIAIQSIADPSNVNDVTGEPEPVVVDPIVHRAVSAVVNEIRNAVETLRDLGLSEDSVAELSQSVIASVASDITRVVAESADSIIEVPVGQNLADVVAQQEAQFEVPMTPEAIASLEGALAGAAAGDAQDFSALQDAVLAVRSEGSADMLAATLDDAAQGLLSGLVNRVSEEVFDSVDQAVAEAADDAALARLFGVDENDAAAITAARDAAGAQRDQQAIDRVRQLFLSMGLAVVIESHADTGVVAVNLPLPFHIPDDELPGGQWGTDRNTRLFTMGFQTLPAESIFTTDSTEVGTDGKQYYAPRFHQLMMMMRDLTGDGDADDPGESLADFQARVDAAYGRISAPDGSPTDEDFLLLDRVNLMHALSESMMGATLITEAVVELVAQNMASSLTLNALADVIAGHFEWASQSVTVTPDGFPIFREQIVTLAGSAGMISPDEVVDHLGLRLGATVMESVELLTESEGFYAGFAADAVQVSIAQAESLTENDTIYKTLRAAYPESTTDYRNLILGTDSIAPDAAYRLAKSRIAKAMAAGLPASLLGSQLSGDSVIDISTAIFLMEYASKSLFTVDEREGFFKSVTLANADASETVERYIPHFDNMKLMVPKPGVAASTLIASLLSLDPVADVIFFNVAVATMAGGVFDLPTLPAFEIAEVDDFGDQVTRHDAIDVSCLVERFTDGSATDGLNALGLSVYTVEYDPLTGEPRKGEVVMYDNAVTEAAADGGLYPRTHYVFEDIPTYTEKSGIKNYGREYLLGFDIPAYDTELPQIFFWVDGYSPEVALCDAGNPMFIGPDRAFMPAPYLSLMADDTEFSDKGGMSTRGVDLSNIETGSDPYLLDQVEGPYAGFIDLYFSSTDTGFSLDAGGSNVGFAPLHGGLEGSIPTFAISGLEPLYGLEALMGANLRTLVESVMSDSSGLTTSIAFDSDPANTDYGKLYLMRDRDNDFWVIEIAYLDVNEYGDGNMDAALDISFAKIDETGRVEAPEVPFGNFPSMNQWESLFDQHLSYVPMYYGDWVVLTPPSGYTGDTLLKPEALAVGADSADYTLLADATDGIVIRYAGTHFDGQVITDTRGFDGVDESFIPLTLDATRSSVTFQRLRFSQSDVAYVLDQNTSTPNSISDLMHGDIVLVFDADSSSDEPVFYGRVIRDPESTEGNRMLGVEWMHYAGIAAMNMGNSESGLGEMFCRSVDDTQCPVDDFPTYHIQFPQSQAEGIVYDLDFDGVPFGFDRNDEDPLMSERHVPEYTQALKGVAEFASDGSGGVTQSILLYTDKVFPPSIAEVIVEGAIFGDSAGPVSLFTCSPPAFDGSTLTDFSCETNETAGSVTVSKAFSDHYGVGFLLDMPMDTISGVGNLVELDYRIVFRAPTDFDGSPVSCGTAACSARPDIEGSLAVEITQYPPMVFTDLMVAVGLEDPVSISTLSSLDASQSLVLSGASLGGATSYELTVACPMTDSDFGPIPAWSETYTAPAFSSAGIPVPPSFALDLQWTLIYGNCDLTMAAMVESDSGRKIGQSVIRFNSISMGVDTAAAVAAAAAAATAADEAATAAATAASAALAAANTAAAAAANAAAAEAVPDAAAAATASAAAAAADADAVLAVADAALAAADAALASAEAAAAAAVASTGTAEEVSASSASAAAASTAADAAAASLSEAEASASDAANSAAAAADSATAAAGG